MLQKQRGRESPKTCKTSEVFPGKRSLYLDLKTGKGYCKQQQYLCSFPERPKPVQGTMSDSVCASGVER